MAGWRRGVGGGSGSNDFSGLGVTTLKVGVIVPTSGVGQFLGDIVQRALGADEAAHRRGGPREGREGRLRDRERARRGVRRRHVEGVQQAHRRSRHHRDPVVHAVRHRRGEAAAPARRHSRDVRVRRHRTRRESCTPTAAACGTCSRCCLPDTMSFDALCNYAKNDRKYASTALIYDKLTLPTAADQFRTAAKNNGLDVVGVEEFTLFSADYGAQLQRLKSAAPHCLIVWGLSDNTAQIVKGLDALGAAYVDTPTARSGTKWAPHILGYPGGTGEKKWAELAGLEREGRDAHGVVSRRSRRRSALPDPRLARQVRRQGRERRRGRRAERVVGVAAGREDGRLDRPPEGRHRARDDAARSSSPGLPFHFGPQNHLGMTPRRRLPDHAREVHGSRRRPIRRTRSGASGRRRSRSSRRTTSVPPTSCARRWRRTSAPSPST